LEVSRTSINLAFTVTPLLHHNDLLGFGFELNQKMIGKISFHFSNMPQRVVPFEHLNRLDYVVERPVLRAFCSPHMLVFAK